MNWNNNSGPWGSGGGKNPWGSGPSNKDFEDTYKSLIRLFKDTFTKQSV